MRNEPHIKVKKDKAAHAQRIKHYVMKEYGGVDV
jgi:hypothetical protein